MHTVHIETDRLIITVFDEDMAESVHLNSLDEDNRNFIPDEVFETKEDALDTIHYLISCYGSENAPLVYPILLKDSQHIGHVQVAPIGQRWEIGYHVGKRYTQKGYATEAVKSFLPMITEQLGLDTITGVCHANNTASRKVLEKCGFLLEFDGMERLQGKIQHTCRYEWQAPKRRDSVA
ncbi:MAG: GNAT family N-acetyltransferase [Dehalococcoidales bacterium]|jgi:RimJ/RimL family protein N-acetyltransferase